MIILWSNGNIYEDSIYLRFKTLYGVDDLSSIGECKYLLKELSLFIQKYNLDVSEKVPSLDSYTLDEFYLYQEQVELYFNLVVREFVWDNKCDDKSWFEIFNEKVKIYKRSHLKYIEIEQLINDYKYKRDGFNHARREFETIKAEFKVFTTNLSSSSEAVIFDNYYVESLKNQKEIVAED